MHLLLRGVIATVIAGAAGVAGGVIGYQSVPEIIPGVTVPMPHHTPPTTGGAAFRFAMIHDVLHERYAKHGSAFYRERERLARDKLRTLPPDSDEAFALTDDIAAGFDRLGKPADAVPLLRDKLKLQEKRGLKGRELYTTYANLGTFLVHAHMGKAMRGDADATAAVREGLGFVEKSVEVNPDAHFGREKWQGVIIKFILSAIEKPELLRTTDCLGNKFSREFPSEAFAPAGYDYERGQRKEAGTARPYYTAALMAGGESITRHRKYITRVGEDEKGGAQDIWGDEHGIAFDDAMLGVIGMWRQGGGANPHFAVCIGEVMLRVGQRRLAWAGFERANRLAERYWPDPATQQFLRDHCARRQKLIEETLCEQGAALRAEFDAELVAGETYQREYQDYEAVKIAGGGKIDDEHFFDDFNSTHPPIATPPGPEEWLVTERVDYVGPKAAAAAWGLFGAGVGAMLTAVVLRRWRIAYARPAGRFRDG